VREDQRALTLLERLAALREGIAVGYVPLAAAQTDVRKLTVTESHPLMLPEAAWGKIKVGARTPPVRVREGWLAFIDGVDELEHPSGAALMRYCAPGIAGEVHGTVGARRFPHRNRCPRRTRLRYLLRNGGL
jgi:predicted GH43/DUF377 family glycosyl hydrolase